MEPLTRTNYNSVLAESEKAKTNTSTSEFWKNAEENRFGITPMILLIIGIVGGIAAATGIMDSWIKLAAVAFPSTISLALILSVAPMRAIYTSAAIAIVLDLLIIFL